MKTLDLRTAEQWRKWLAEHHDSETQVWLVFHKRHTGRASIPYENAVDQALCFGWIDSLVKRLDEARYARKFTPRKADSRWSDTNRKRYARLKAGGQLTPAGLNRRPTDRGYAARAPLPTKEPPYLRAVLKQHPPAWDRFESLAPSHRRRYLGWIDSAKRQQTKSKRLRETIRLLKAGRPLGLK
ncbi:MAG: YdeI/OmpD-associated family protein [Verrucomicrobia bacterium]|nr:YdeI/OmpD-associated family protein [Verrucomicrobiota bacterium]